MGKRTHSVEENRKLQAYRVDKVFPVFFARWQERMDRRFLRWYCRPTAVPPRHIKEYMEAIRGGN